MDKYLVTVTDIFGGELNYPWAEHYIVKAKNIRAAAAKVSKYTERKTRKLWNTGDECGVYHVIGSPIAYDIEYVDESDEWVKDKINNLHHVTKL